MKHHIGALEKKIIRFCSDFGFTFLRLSFGIIYFWFGAQKIFETSPITELVEKTTDWMGIPYFIYILGIWEILIGLGFLIPKLMKISLLLLFLHFPGTFLPLFLNPEDCFTHFPFGLTLEGQYIFKNLISISSAIILTGSLNGRDKPGNKVG